MSADQPEPIQVHPEAELTPRPCDLVLSADRAKGLSLFSGLKKSPPLGDFPGAFVLRRYLSGEVIYRQGEPGHSAFYILTPQDAAALGLPNDRPGQGENDVAATVLLVSKSSGKPGGFLRGLRTWLRGKERRSNPEFIPIDAPTDLDATTGQASLFAGDTFGEMSCLTFSPRSGTVVAKDPIWVFEFQRNVLDRLEADEGYRKKSADNYRQRVLNAESGHLRQLAFLKGLTPAQFARISDSAELETYEPGQVLCEQGATSDCIFVIRRGIVQVILNASFQFRSGDVAEWLLFCRALISAGETIGGTVDKGLGGSSAPAAKEAPKADAPTAPDSASPSPAKAPPKGNPLAALAKKPSAPALSAPALVWSKLNPDVQAAMRAASESGVVEEQLKVLICREISQMATVDKFLSNEGLKPVLAAALVASQTESFPNSIDKWNEFQRRVAWRAALSVVFPLWINDFRNRQTRIRRYMSRGECFGEIGVVRQLPRSATCVAFDHPPDPGSGARRTSRVELIRIPAGVFRQLLEDSPELSKRTESLLAERLSEPGDDPQRPLAAKVVPRTDQYHQLGLFQGQQLLTIDLDACTRCGDCVRACINSHDDGRTRLFLDGPRYDRFLIPSACRQCRDPLCMIGCPVGSIQRGENGQIEIRDWCIGCAKCADQCPYDSIQMHDEGILADAEADWRFSTAPKGGLDPWFQPRYQDRHWSSGMSPFLWRVEFAAELQRFDSSAAASNTLLSHHSEIRFRKQVSVSQDELANAARFTLQIVAAKSMQLLAWINGKAIELHETKFPQLTMSHRIWSGIEGRFAKDSYQAQVASVDTTLIGRHNVLAVSLSVRDELPPNFVDGQVILLPRLDSVGRLGESGRGAVLSSSQSPDIEVETVAQKAVVCDLCQSVPGGQPACVRECPHDAAIRIDGLSEMRW